MKKFTLGKFVLIVGSAAVLIILAFVIYLLSSSRITSKYNVYLRYAFDAAEVSGAGVYVQDGDDWRLLDSDHANKLYFYMTSQGSTTFRRGDKTDPRLITLRIGTDIATITPVSEDNNDSAVVAITLNNKKYHVKVTIDSLWSRLANVVAP